MTSTVQQPLLDEPPAASEQASASSPLAPIQEKDATTSLAMTLERLAANPAVDVAKLERIIALQERMLAHSAKSAFDAAFARMQGDIPEVSEHGKMIVKGQLRNTYAKLEDIHEAVKPVLSAHGFAMRHRTEFPAEKPGVLRIVGILSHASGHSEESCFEAPMDKSEYRTDIQSMGSTVSYGRRYTTMDLLNIVTRNADDDGRAGRQAEPAEVVAPAGFDSWLLDLEDVADTGLSALEAAWKQSKTEYRRHLTSTNAPRWESLKRHAARVKPAGAQ